MNVQHCEIATYKFRRHASILLKKIQSVVVLMKKEPPQRGVLTCLMYCTSFVIVSNN